MRKSTISLGTISMLVGLVMCMVKAGGAGLITWSWWAVTAPIWGPFAIFFIVMLFFAAIVGARGGADKLAEEVFDTDDEPNVTPEDIEAFKKFMMERNAMEPKK